MEQDTNGAHRGFQTQISPFVDGNMPIIGKNGGFDNVKAMVKTSTKMWGVILTNTVEMSA